MIMPDLLQSLALALAIGLLVGLERGWTARAEPAGHRVAGFRTFGLLGLLGGLAVQLPLALGVVILGGAALALLAGYVLSSNAREHSATSAIAGLLTMGLGALAGSGQATGALAAAAVMVLLLAMRPRLHEVIRGISPAELEAASRFAIISLVILPLVPSGHVGPYDAWNPRQLWFLVVLVSGLSFAGYVISRRVDPGRGLLAAAAAGGLVSSTAVTASYARRLPAAGEAEPALVAGIGLASAVMTMRYLLLATLLMPQALATLAPVLLAAGAILLIPVLPALRKGAGNGGGQVDLGNPLDLKAAFVLVALVAGLAVLSRWASAMFGDMGVGLIATLTGFADVDAALITITALPKNALAPGMAGLLLALPVLANNLLKALLALVLGGWKRGFPAAWPLLASVGAGLLLLILLQTARVAG